MKRTLIPLAIVVLAALALAVPAVHAKDGARIIALKAPSSFAGAKGKAKFQTDGQRELEIEIEHIRRLAGTRVSFFVNRAKVGASRVSGLGEARLDRRGSNFPAIKFGTRITVKTADTTIASGRF
jgi:hypothetical protein